MGSIVMKRAHWSVLILLAVVGIAGAQVYNYFPPPGIIYTQTGGMALGSATGGAQGPGTLNATNLYINGVAVTSGEGTVTTVSVVSANGLSGTVANPTTTPAITLGPAFTGIAYSTGSAFQAAIASNFPTLNQNTTGNAATATTASTASALATTPALCSSGQAAQGILANGNATGCITPYSVINENANTFFAGPTSGTAALPGFRLMVPADLPLSSAIAWTGDHTFTPSSGVAITATGASGAAALAITGASNADAVDISNGASQYAKIIGSSTTGESNGLGIAAGTNSSDVPLEVANRAGSEQLFAIYGNGGAVSGTPTGGDEGLGTFNAVTLYQNGSLLPTLSGGGNFTTAPTINSKPITTALATYGTFSITGSTCGQQASTSINNVASCTFNSTGNATITFTTSYANAPACTASSETAADYANVADITLTNFQIQNINGGTLANGVVTFNCLGN